MIQDQTLNQNSKTLATSPSKSLFSSKLMSRKPALLNYTKKRQNQTSQSQNIENFRFISPSRANLIVDKGSKTSAQSAELNETVYMYNESINYEFIKQCVSPKSIQTRENCKKSNLRKQTEKCSSIEVNRFVETEINDFSKEAIQRIQNKNIMLQQQLQIIRNQNLKLRKLLDQKSQQMEKRKIQYQNMLCERDREVQKLTKKLSDLQSESLISQQKIIESQEKNLHHITKYKQLKLKLSQTTQKLDKAQKQVKMYKAKYRINFNHSAQKDQTNCKKYHQHCCKPIDHSANNTKNQQKKINKQNLLRQSKKTNVFSSVKQIKSQKVLPSLSNENLPSVSSFIEIKEQIPKYVDFQTSIQNLSKQIYYKDIEIITLRKLKCDFQNQRQNHKKVKAFNKKLLAKVQELTRNSGKQLANKNLSSPFEVTPTRKSSFQFDFDVKIFNQIDERFQLELSPQRILTQRSSKDLNKNQLDIKDN